MGNRNAIMSLLTFADKVEPTLWDKHEEILAAMDLQGAYQYKNLRTALAALDVLICQCLIGGTDISQALVHTAARTGFRGRWEKISDNPVTICDIGHNEHGLKYNFAQLERIMASGECTHLIIVYGSVADKDVDAVIHLMPERATYIFTQAHGKRALPAEQAMNKYMKFCEESGRQVGDVYCIEDVVQARRKAESLSAAIMQENPDARPMIYIGGSTYVVSEAVAER